MITCSTDLSVQTVRWLNTSDSGRELARLSSAHQLDLVIERVSAYQDSTTYTCEVLAIVSGGTQVILEPVTIKSKLKIEIPS